MIFRDLAQAAFRMRGIAKGQRITFLVIPEVLQLAQTAAKTSKAPNTGVLSLSFPPPGSPLTDVYDGRGSGGSVIGGGGGGSGGGCTL